MHSDDHTWREPRLRPAQRRERDLLEWAVSAVAGSAAEAEAVIDEGMEAGLGGTDPITLHLKMVRLELLTVKSGLERELERLLLDCSECGREVFWMSGLGVQGGHWVHRELSSHHEPVLT